MSASNGLPLFRLLTLDDLFRATRARQPADHQRRWQSNPAAARSLSHGGSRAVWRSLVAAFRLAKQASAEEVCQRDLHGACAG